MSSEVSECKPLMRGTGSPHHLCLHLCYYREYDAARQLFVLRTRCCAALGSAAVLDGWRAELRLAETQGRITSRHVIHSILNNPRL